MIPYAYVSRACRGRGIERDRVMTGAGLALGDVVSAIVTPQEKKMDEREPCGAIWRKL